MYGYTISRILRNNIKTRGAFFGVYSIDMLKHSPWYPYFVIVNTAVESVSDGHWVLLYFKNENNVIFFDSFGRDLSDVDTDNMLGTYVGCARVTHCKYQLQSKFSKVCGYYCLFVAHRLCLGFQLPCILNTFTCNFEYNDYIIVKRVCNMYVL